MSPFYQKYVDAMGIPVLASTKVPDDALLVARDIVNTMLAKRPDLRASMIERNWRTGIIADVEIDDGPPGRPGSRKATPRHLVMKTAFDTCVSLALIFLTCGIARPASAQAPFRTAGQTVRLTVTPVSDHTLRFTVRPLAPSANAVAVTDGEVLVRQDFGEPILEVSSLDGPRSVSHAGLHVHVRPSPLTVRVTTAAGSMVQELVFDEEEGGVQFLVGDGPVYGLGSGGASFDRRGSFFPMQRGHRHGEYLAFGARTPAPFLIGTGGATTGSTQEAYSLFVHRPYSSRFDLRGTTGRILPAAKGGYYPQRGLLRPSTEERRKEAPLPLDVFLTHVDEPERALSERTRYLGNPAMPPKWALGYMQSHRNLSVGGSQEMMDVARTFREKELPVDALIYLGTGFTAGGWNTGNGEFSFHPEVFDRPQRILDTLTAMNYKVVLHVASPPRRLHGILSDPAPPDQEDHVVTYWSKHRPIMQMGVDGWWPDMGDELDDDTRLLRHRLYYEGSLDEKPDERPWSLHRTGFPGMNRYGGWTWSGDVNSSWDALAAHVPVGINASLSTGPFWGTDIAGFYPTEDMTGELYARWFQFGAFNASFRAHGVAWRTRLPWGWNPGEMGPVQMVEYLRTGSLAADTAGGLEYRGLELHDARIEPVIRKYLELRYRLMPYTYTAAREAHDSGLPLMRALWLHYPDDPEAAAQTHQYLWGPDLLVAPVVEEGVGAPVHDYAMKDVYLPEGLWYDFWRTNEAIPGNQTLRLTVDLETLPLYVRAGTVLPMDPVRQYVDEPVVEPTTLRIYPGADGESSLYDDDGRSMAFTRGEVSWTRFIWEDGPRTLTIEPERGPAVARTYRVLVVGEEGEREIEYTGERIEVSLSAEPPER